MSLLHATILRKMIPSVKELDGFGNALECAAKEIERLTTIHAKEVKLRAVLEAAPHPTENGGPYAWHWQFDYCGWFDNSRRALTDEQEGG